MLGLECFPSPGHASHHVCYLDGDGTLYAGDAAGVRIQPHRAVLPPTPPPEFDLDVWLTTLDEIERRGPEQLALIHFGLAGDVARHLAELRSRLDEWAALDGVTEEEFVETVSADVDSGLDEYARAMPFWQSYAGLKRYWESVALLRNRNFALLFASRSISYFGRTWRRSQWRSPSCDLTGSATDTGIAFACWTLAQVSTLMVGGVVADRLPRRLVMVGVRPRQRVRAHRPLGTCCF